MKRCSCASRRCFMYTLFTYLASYPFQYLSSIFMNCFFLSSSLSWPVPSVGLHSLLAHRYDSFLCRHHHLRDGIRQQTETCRQQAEEWLKQKARHRRRSVLPMAQAVPVIILKYRYTGEFITENKFRFYDLRGISCWSEVLICGKFQTLYRRI